MRVEQHVTFAWEVNADEDAVICTGLDVLARSNPPELATKAALLLATRRGSSIASTVNGAPQPMIQRKLPDVDLLAEQVPEGQS